MKEKIVGIGIIVLVGLASLPTSAKTVTIYADNERVELTPNEIERLQKGISALQTSTSEGIEIIKSVLPNFDFPKKGIPIASIGEAKKIFPSYLPDLKFEKLFTVWYYPTDFGATMIWGEGLFSPPTQVLQKKQIGFMLGFKGFYLYLPAWLTGFGNITVFLGTAAFVWGKTL